MADLSTRVPVEHRTFFGLDRRLVLPAVAIWLVGFLFYGVLPGIQSILKHEEPIAAGTVLDVTPAVKYTPASGWGINLDSIGVGSGTSSVTDEGVTFEVTVGQFQGDADALADQINTEVDSRFNYQVYGPRTTVRTTQGVTGVAESFNGPGVQGRLFAFTKDGTAVQVIASGPEGSVATKDKDINQMAESIVFTTKESA